MLEFGWLAYTQAFALDFSRPLPALTLACGLTKLW